MSDSKEQRQIYALLVGIDAYPRRGMQLNGCRQDVAGIESYLQTHFVPKQLQIRKLLDEQATYHNIAEAFRTHLCQAGPTDTVWFHFSGHGSEQPTAVEFEASVEPNGKDQTLVTYNPRPGNGIHHLADKELAVLLMQVADFAPSGVAKSGSPHIVVTLDCCHSGSGTRYHGIESALKTRGFGAGGQATRRPLESYANGFYRSQLDRNQSLQVPLTQHVLLAACESVQTAGDLPSGGLFSTGFLHALRQAEGRINYADLYRRTQDRVRKIRRAQTPKFSTINNFNPYQRFLGGAELGNKERYPLIHKMLRRGGTWFAGVGAIHGLPVAAESEVEIDIFRTNDEKARIGKGRITAVGAQRSHFELTSGGPLDSNQYYQLEVRQMPLPPISILCRDQDTILESLVQSNNLPVSFRIGAGIDREDTDLELRRQGDGYCLYSAPDERLITKIRADSRGHAFLLEAWQKIIKWRRILLLRNARSFLFPHARLSILEAGPKGQLGILAGPEVKVYLCPQQHFFAPQTGAIGVILSPQLTFGELPHRVYCYLLRLSSSYAIECEEGEIIFRPEEHQQDPTPTIPLTKGKTGWGLEPGENEAFSYLKVLLTTESLHYQQFLQTGIGKSPFRDSWQRLQRKNDWSTLTTRLAAVRKLGTIGPDHTVSLLDGRLTVLPTTGLTGEICLVNAYHGAESQDPIHRFPLFNSAKRKMLSFYSAHKGQRYNVLEIVELSVKGPDPRLQVLVSLSLPAGEKVIPWGFTGEDFGPVGSSVRHASGQTLITIDQFPTPLNGAPLSEQLVPNPFDPDDLQHQSLYTAYKIAFFRTGSNGHLLD